MNTTTSKCLSLLPKCKYLISLKQLHATLLTTGVYSDPFIAGRLILQSAVSLSSSIDYALRLFRNFPYPDVFMYNTLIRGLAEADKPLKSLSLFVELKRVAGYCVDSFSFAFAVKAASYLGCLRSGVQLHCQALVLGFNTHVFVGSSLISMYGECGCVGYARNVFDEMPERNVVVWNAVVTACVRCGDVEDARSVFDLMPVRDLTSWNLMLSGYAKAGKMEAAKRVFTEMPIKDEVSWSTMVVGFVHDGQFDEAFGAFRELRREGMRVNEVSLTGVLSACAQAGALEFGKIVHCFSEKSGFMWILSVNNALIDTYTRCGDVSMAQLVFQLMSKNRSIVSWTTMMAGLAMHGHGEEAIKLFHEMEEAGVRPDGITFIALLYACSHAGLVAQGCCYFAKMKDVYKVEPTYEHYGCMVDLYGRAGQLKKAYEFVSQMPIPPNAIIWRTLLGACSIHGDIKLAEQVKGRLSELEPKDCSDHVLISNVYAVTGKWNDAAAVRRSMLDQKIKKLPGWSMIEVDKVVYTFAAGLKTDPFTVEAYEKLKEIVAKLRDEGGYVPKIENVLYDIEEEEKEHSVSMHSEKLALAFGIARQGGTKMIRIIKNLRICGDCHTLMKISSQVFKLKIVVRDRSRFHTFIDGSCSCGDYW